MSEERSPQPQFRRVDEEHRPAIRFFINGKPSPALLGDTVLTSLLINGYKIRISEFGDGPRAGFCNMGACQDCWVTLEEGTRLRACSEFIRDGMRIIIE